MFQTGAKKDTSSKQHGASKEKPRRRFKAAREFLKQNTDEYCRNTTLHGLKYITSPDLYPLEKVFFAISFVTVLFGSIFFIFKIYNKWDTTPVILSINPKPTFITMEPFPAVTICNLNQAYKSKAKQFSIYSAEYALIQMLCKREANGTIAGTITDWSILKNFIVEISQPCEEMILTCRFGAVNYNCSELFHPVVTDNGLCCTFNMVNPHFLYTSKSPLRTNVTYPPGVVPVDWSAEKGYPPHLPKSFLPMTTLGTGESLGLSVTLNVEADEYFCSSSNSIGFKVLLHNSNEVPSMREIGLLLAPGHETKVRIRAEKTESDLSLRSMDRNYRGCIFQDEQELQIFSRYTQRNCEIECVAKKLLTYCGCISHFMPSLDGNETICSIYDATCVEQVRLQSMVVDFDTDGSACPYLCWPSCFDMTFLPDFFFTHLNHSGFQIMNQVVKNISNGYVERNIAVVHMYFKDNTYRSRKQAEFIGVTDFLSSVGGLIGLFFGFSFISVAEFLFYAFLRPCRVVIVYKKAQMAMAKRLSLVQKSQLFKKRNQQQLGNPLDADVVGPALQPFQISHIPEPIWNEDSEKKPLRTAWQPGMEYTP